MLKIFEKLEFSFLLFGLIIISHYTISKLIHEKCSYQIHKINVNYFLGRNRRFYLIFFPKNWLLKNDSNLYANRIEHTLQTNKYNLFSLLYII